MRVSNTALALASVAAQIGERHLDIEAAGEELFAALLHHGIDPDSTDGWFLADTMAIRFYNGPVGHA